MKAMEAIEKYGFMVRSYGCIRVSYPTGMVEPVDLETLGRHAAATGPLPRRRPILISMLTLDR